MYKLIECTSRRSALRSLAGCLLTMVSVEGCAQSSSSSPATTLTSSAHHPGKVLYSYRGHTDRVTTVAWSPNGTYVASGSLDKTVQVWAVLNKQSQPFVYHGHTDGVTAVDWSPDSKYIVSGSIDKTVQVWDARTGEHAALYQGHTDIVMTVAWSPDGKSIASGSADGTIRVWDSATAQQKYIYRGHGTNAVHSLAWSSDSQRIASGAEDKTVQILDAASGNVLYTYHGHSNTVSSVAWSPDGKFIASGSWDKTVQVWNATTGAVSFTYNGYNVQIAGADPAHGVLPDLIFAVAWSHNGKRIAAVTQEYCGDSCGVVLQWDAYTGRNLTFFANALVFAIAYSPDDTRLATAIVIFTQGDAGATIKPDNGAHVEIVQAT